MDRAGALRRGVAPLTALALLAWVGAALAEQPGPIHTGSEGPLEAPAVHPESTIMVVASDRPSVAALAKRADTPRALSAELSTVPDLESPSAWGVRAILVPWPSALGPLAVGLARRGPPPPVAP